MSAAAVRRLAPLPHAAALAGAATAISSMIALQWWLAGVAPDLLIAFIIELPVWLAWALMTPAIFHAGHRWPLAAGSWLRHLPIHTVLALVASFLCIAFTVLTRTLIGLMPAGPLLLQIVQGFRGTFGMFVLTYFAILALHQSLAYRSAYDGVVEQQLAADAQLARARLQMVKSQLQPHFLFNTLNTISSLVTREPKLARLLLVRLSDLLRTVLHRSSVDLVTLGDELDFAETYLEIQLLRFGDHLQVSRDVTPDALDAKVPPMLIQPLVENAIVHGLRAGGSVRIWLKARRTADRVVVTVSDDGPGFDDGGPVRGHGLELVESLLKQGLNGYGTIEYHGREGGGAEVTVTLRDGGAA